MQPYKTAVEIHDMSVVYNKKPVLWDIDIHFPQGQLIGILGPNGVGKSTLLKAMMNIVPKSSGYVKFFGQPLEKMRKHISYIPQRQSVDWEFPANVYDIVMMGRYPHMGIFKRPNANDKKIVYQALQQVDMLPFAQRQIGALSGGQQQRIFIARALAQEANIYFLDEPLAGVDASSSTLILSLLKKIVANNKTVIMIHHSLETIEEYFDYVVLLNMYIRAVGPTKKVLTPTLLQETYGSQLNILSNISHLLQQEGISIREKQ